MSSLDATLISTLVRKVVCLQFSVCKQFSRTQVNILKKNWNGKTGERYEVAWLGEKARRQERSCDIHSVHVVSAGADVVSHNNPMEKC